MNNRFPNYKVKRLKGFENDSIQRTYMVTDADEKKIVQIVTTEGFVDEIELLIIIDYINERIEGLEVLRHNESHDYGGLLTEDWFLDRFKNKGVDKYLTIVKMAAKKENEIVAITGATKTSQGVVDAVNLSIDNFMKIRGKDDD